MKKIKYFVHGHKELEKDLFTFGENDDFAFVKMTDSNLARFYTHTQNGYFIISASRNNYTDEENIERTKKLEQNIRNAGLGFISTLGGYVEDKNIPVEELSFLVPYRKEYGTQKEFLQLALDLCKKYEQESVLIQLPDFNNGKAVYVNGNADVDMVFEGWGIKKENEPYYTRLEKGSHSDKPFTFRDAEPNELDRFTKFKRVYLTLPAKQVHKDDLDMNLD